MAAEWKESFLATSAVLGVSVDDALASMCRPAEVEGTPLVQRLRATSRQTRARAIAEVLTKVGAALPQQAELP